MSNADSSKVTDKVEQTITLDIGPARYVKVLVTADSGIFKNGHLYAKGKEAVIVLSAAQRFEAAGEVEILEEVEQ